MSSTSTLLWSITLQQAYYVVLYSYGPPKPFFWGRSFFFFRPDGWTYLPAFCSAFQSWHPLVKITRIARFGLWELWNRLQSHCDTLVVTFFLSSSPPLVQFLASGTRGWWNGKFWHDVGFFFSTTARPPLPPPSFLMRYNLITCVTFLWHQSHIM